MEVGNCVVLKNDYEVTGVVTGVYWDKWITFRHEVTGEEFEYHIDELNLVVDIPSLV